MIARLLSLLLPALIPSWRFFKTVGPSPRVEYRLIHSGQPGTWQEDRPRPQRLGLGQMLRRMLWNPSWNEQLFMVSCAERLMEEETAHSLEELNLRIASQLMGRADCELQFRLVFLYRNPGEDALVKEVGYESVPVALMKLKGRGRGD